MKRKNRKQLKHRDSFSDSGWSSDEESEAEQSVVDEVEIEVAKEEQSGEEVEAVDNERKEYREQTFMDEVEEKRGTGAVAIIEDSGEQKGEKRKLEELPSQRPAKKLKTIKETEIIQEQTSRPTVKRARAFAHYTSSFEVHEDAKLLPVREVVGNRWVAVSGKKFLQLKLRWKRVEGVQLQDLWVFRHNTKSMEGLLQRWNHKCFQESKR